MAGRPRFERDYYGTLGVGPEATDDDIRKTYRRLALTWHPDRNRGDAGAAERFKEISEAYAVLIDARTTGGPRPASRPLALGAGGIERKPARPRSRDAAPADAPRSPGWDPEARDAGRRSAPARAGRHGSGGDALGHEAQASGKGPHR